MGRLAIRWSTGGAIAAGLFLVLAKTVFARVFWVASKNPADSAESGLLLLPFAMPWIGIMPSSWIGTWTGRGCVLGNMLCVNLVFGGLRFKNTAVHSGRSRDPER